MSTPCPQPFCNGRLRSGGKRYAGKLVVRYCYCDRCDYGERREYLPEVLVRTSRLNKSGSAESKQAESTLAAEHAR